MFIVIAMSPGIEFALIVGGILLLSGFFAKLLVDDIFGRTLNRCPACRMEPVNDEVNSSYSSYTGYRFIPCEKHAAKKEEST